ncbi:variant surface antigen E [Biomphalaria glabrata]|nr:variant surface antigen E-like [Biomphalaria glabrata]
MLALLTENFTLFFSKIQILNFRKSNDVNAQKDKRIIPKKDNEVLVVLGNAGEERLEWRDEDLIEDNFIFESAPQAEEEYLPVYTIDEHMKTLWEKIDEK